MMGWGSMYFTGYRNPTVWAELGMMGDKLSFTNDDTVNKLGLGRTERLTPSKCSTNIPDWRLL